MKRYAYMDVTLVFNCLAEEFDKKTRQWIEQKTDEAATVKAFEKKYGVRLKYVQVVGADHSYNGYSVTA